MMKIVWVIFPNATSCRACGSFNALQRIYLDVYLVKIITPCETGNFQMLGPKFHLHPHLQGVCVCVWQFNINIQRDNIRFSIVLLL